MKSLQTTVFQCEDSIEGILTGVYDAYASRLGHENCRLSVGSGDYELFCVYRKVKPSMEKTEKVMRTLKREFGEENFLRICYAMASFEEDKAEAVYKSIVVGLQKKLGCRMFEHLSDPYVMRMFALQRNVNFELMNLRGFVRFRELENGVLLSIINPKNNQLPFLMPHFSDRFPLENFMIYDEVRNLAGIHYSKSNSHTKTGAESNMVTDTKATVETDTETEAGMNGDGVVSGADWFMIQPGYFDREVAEGVTSEEQYYQELFRTFQKTIEIEARRNPKLQKQKVPLRYRGNMTEFQ